MEDQVFDMMNMNDQEAKRAIWMHRVWVLKALKIAHALRRMQTAHINLMNAQQPNCVPDDEVDEAEWNESEAYGLVEHAEIAILFEREDDLTMRHPVWRRIGRSNN